MGQGRLSSFCRISIHKDIVKHKEDSNVLHDQVVQKFIEKPRRWLFFINDAAFYFISGSASIKICCYHIGIISFLQVL